MNTQELGEEYRSKSDEELLRLALVPEELTTEARVALTGELVRRRINDETHLTVARKQEAERKAANDRNIGTLGLIHFCGIGRLRLGRADRIYSPDTDLEQFRTTVFIVLFCFPLIPMGTYLVERKPAFPDHLKVLEKLPLDWEQILKVWIVAIGSIFAAILVIQIAASDTVWRFGVDYSDKEGPNTDELKSSTPTPPLVLSPAARHKAEKPPPVPVPDGEFCRAQPHPCVH
jgi:hypothetical protein